MKKTISLVVSVLILSACATVSKFTAEKNKDGDLVGIITKENLQQEPYGSEWFNDFYGYYEIENKTSNEIKENLKGIRIKGFMGTWCGDSQREIPNFYKLLDATDFNYKNLELIAVNRAKKAKDLEKGYNIIRVPTFIFYKGGKEIGRFVEHPNDDSTIEDDILKIISGKPYKHSYEK